MINYKEVPRLARDTEIYDQIVDLEKFSGGQNEVQRNKDSN